MRTVGRGRPMSMVEVGRNGNSVVVDVDDKSVVRGGENHGEGRQVDPQVELMRKRLRRGSRRWSSGNWTLSLPVIWEGEDEDEASEDDGRMSYKRERGGSMDSDIVVETDQLDK